MVTVLDADHMVGNEQNVSAFLELLLKVVHGQTLFTTLGLYLLATHEADTFHSLLNHGSTEWVKALTTDSSEQVKNL